MGLACDFFSILPLGSWALHVPLVLMTHAVSLYLLPTAGLSHDGLNTRWKNNSTQCLLRNTHTLVVVHTVTCLHKDSRIGSIPRFTLGRLAQIGHVKGHKAGEWQTGFLRAVWLPAGCAQCRRCEGALEASGPFAPEVRRWLSPLGGPCSSSGPRGSGVSLPVLC